MHECWSFLQKNELHFFKNINHDQGNCLSTSTRPPFVQSGVVRWIQKKMCRKIPILLKVMSLQKKWGKCLIFWPNSISRNDPSSKFFFSNFHKYQKTVETIVPTSGQKVNNSCILSCIITIVHILRSERLGENSLLFPSFRGLNFQNRANFHPKYAHEHTQI